MDRARWRDAIAARLGGDEFTLLIDGVRGVLDPQDFAETLLRLLASPYRIEVRDVHCSVSIGINLSDAGYESAGDMLIEECYL